MNDLAMDIDSDTTAAPSFGKKHPLPLLQDELTKFNNAMAMYSTAFGWKKRIEIPGNVMFQGSDSEFLQGVMSIIILELSTTSLKKNIPPDAKQLIEGLNDNELKEWQKGVKAGVETGDWAELAAHVKHRSPYPAKEGYLGDQRINRLQKLTTAYKTLFIGDAAVNFIEYLKVIDGKVRANTKQIYAKAVPVVQSSGTGKSRMLTEVGRQIFTLPICLRQEVDPGYPPSDPDVVKYFSALSKDNDLSLTAHLAIACFLAATHMVMLDCLRTAQNENQLDGLQLLEYWNKLMEPQGACSQRALFWAEVVERANSLKSQAKTPFTSPKRGPTGDPDPKFPNPIQSAAQIYKSITKKATEELMEFLSIQSPQALSVTYFDEAHELGLCFWIVLRLLQSQDPLTRMWYVFMGTKSSLSYYSPRPTDRLSLRLKEELNELLPPYIALGFDQQMIAKRRAETSHSMGYIRSIEHLSQYGRPLWNAHLPESKREMINLASLKLTNGDSFSQTNTQHVFTILSQRLCLDPVMAASEAIKLADRSVSHHMRLLTGFNGEIFYTHSPSEPMLVLGSIDILYNTEEKDRLGSVLQTLSRDLCSSGLVEKGGLGELGARILLLIARDFSAPIGHTRDLLLPVPLLSFLHTLFGNKAWAGSNQSTFDTAFDKAHVNFTHWMVTKDPMPEIPDLQLLANLWARGAAMQCCFTQEAIDFVIPIYIGSILEDAIFDPSCLSVIAGQVKFKVAGDKKAEYVIRPIGIPRDLNQPLPYLAMLMELGNESNYQENGSKIKSMAFNSVAHGEFKELRSKLDVAVKHLQSHRDRDQEKRKQGDSADTKAFKQAVKEAQLAMDSYNRYSISVRGATPDVYQILRKAGIVDKFATLLKVTMPSPTSEDDMIQYMQPLERLGVDSNHTAWMSEYVVQ